MNVLLALRPQNVLSLNRSSRLTAFGISSVTISDWRLAGLFRDLTAKGQTAVGGHSEFFNMPEKIAKAKFANAHRKANRAKGFETVTWKRQAGIHGCPTPLENPEEKGYAL